MTKTLLAIRHVSFEDLGSFEAPLTRAGYTIRYCDMGLDELPAVQPDMLVVLGAPIGAYEDDIYPFLKSENALIATQLKAQKPLLGICLGAQMIARALGARVYPGRAKEIGWQKLTLTEAGETLLAPLKDLPMLHWHGDTFDLPDGAINLASTPDCDHQAFTYGQQVLAFQFHPEVQEKGFERWLIGHTAEIAATKGASVPELRAATRLYAPAAEEQGSAVLAKWLGQLS